MTNGFPGHYLGQPACACTRHHPHHRYSRILGSTIQLSGLAFGSISPCAQVHEREQFSIVLVFTVKLYSQYTSKREL